MAMDVPQVLGDPRFFQRTGPHSLAAIADAADAMAPPRRLMLHGVAPLQTATGREVSFLDNRKYLPLLETTGAGAVIVHPDYAARVPSSAVAIVTAEPYVAWAKVAALFHPLPPASPGIHPSAVVSPDAKVDPTAEIGPLAVIGPAAEIGPRCLIGPLAVIGDGVVMGRDCRIGTHVSVSHALLGDRVCLYPGARIGQDGFGFAISSDGFHSVPQLGRVIIHNDVQVGANTAIDRGSAGDTVIGEGSRLDNLVQIGHNVRLGRCCVLVSQAGVSGSTVLEDYVMLGGQAGMVGHITIGRGARVGAQAGVMADVPAGHEVAGSPAQPVKAFFRELAVVRRLVRQDESRRSKETRSRAAGTKTDQDMG